jgi:hypothetical protein
LNGPKAKEVTKSREVQSIRATVEQTFSDLKHAKVLEKLKFSDVDKAEKLLDCVIALHNLRI